MNREFTKHDIESLGFIYEPDMNKCKSYNIKTKNEGYNIYEGVLIGDTSFTSENIDLVKSIPIKHINSIFIYDLPDGVSNGHWETWIKIVGH